MMEKEELYLQESLGAAKEEEETSEAVPSDKIELYRQGFIHLTNKIEHDPSSFSQYGISYRSIYKHFSLKVVDELNNYQIVTLHVQLGHFFLKVKVLNTNDRSPMPFLLPSAHGRYGEVKVFNLMGESVAVKSFGRKEQQEQISRNLGSVIRQYCIMKICSAMKIGPSATDYLGFNIIFFSDRIQFAMEACRAVQNNSIDDLLLCIGVLHRYQIVHGDVNCSNIMFSPTFGKNVLIDFGFSEGLKEECGYKTFTSFRGTPKYVSPEMLKLFSLECKLSFIDLYYNDLVCFHNTRRYFSDTASKQLDIQELLRLQQTEAPPPADDKVQRLLEYSYILFKYVVYFRQSQLSYFISRNRQLLKVYATKLLRFLGSLLPSSLVEDLIFTRLRSFCPVDEYQLILLQFKKRREQLMPKQLKKENANNYELRFLHFDLKRVPEQPTSLALQISKYLLEEEELKGQEEKQKYIYLLFDCLRFDRNNLELPMKKKLAQHFIKLVGLVRPRGKDQLRGVRIVMKEILRWCLNLPLNATKKRMFKDMIVQCCLLDLPLPAELSEASLNIQGNYSMSEVISLLYQLHLLTFLYEFKHRFGVNFDRISSTIVAIEKLSESIEKLIVNGSFCKSQEEQFCRTIIRSMVRVRQRKTKLAPDMYNSLIKISSHRVKMALKRMLFLVEINLAREQSDFSIYSQTMTRIKDEFVQQIRPRSKEFLETMIWTFLILKEDAWQSQFEKFIKQIRATINCHQIFNDFVFKIYLEEESGESFSKDFQEVVQACFVQNRFTYFWQELKYLLNKMLADTERREANIDQLVDMAQKYFGYLETHPFNCSSGSGRDTSSDERITRKKYQNKTLSQGFLYFYFLSFGPCLQSYALKHEQLVRNSYWRYLQQKSVDQKGTDYFSALTFYNCLNIKACIGKQFYLVKQHQVKTLRLLDSSLPHFISKRLIIHLLTALNCQRLSNQFMRSVLVWGWKYHRVHNYMVAYFSETQEGSLVISVTLSCLWNSLQPEQTYLFMRDIVAVVSARPYRSYACFFSNNIVHFYKNNKTFFNFDTLKAKFEPINWGNAYQLLCFGFALLECRSRDKLAVMKEIIKDVEMVSWICRERIFNFYFETLLKLRVWKTDQIRKYSYVVKYILTKIHVDFSAYHNDKLKLFMNIFNLGKAQPNRFRQKLRGKLLRWKSKSQNR